MDLTMAMKSGHKTTKNWDNNMDKYHYNKSVIINHNDGNHINGDPPENDVDNKTVYCGYCGGEQQDPTKKFCDYCEQDEFIRNYLRGE